LPRFAAKTGRPHGRRPLFSIFVPILFFTGCAQNTFPDASPAGEVPPSMRAALPSKTPAASPATGTPPQAGSAIPGRTPAAAERRIRPADGKAMVFVPEGEFVMGAADDDPEADPHEKPGHPVYVDAFWIDQTETTNAQFRICVEAGICRAPLTCDFGSPDFADETKADHPAACVTWFDAGTYCEWAGGRLPTEAEWEKAARGTDERRYPWGNTIDCSRGNFRGCPQFFLTAPVGSFPSGISPYGALDMAGNVWEWVDDWMGWDYYRASPADNPPGPDNGEMRVVRGGSFRYFFRYMRVVTRHCAPPEHRADALGFRCVFPE
jgi:formylglycine-generating enzyme required for sulfatase activity